MILTEDDAKTKRCQESFGPSPQPATTCNAMSANSTFYTVGIPHTASPLNCIGSECMAWRETESAYPGDVHATAEDSGMIYYRLGTQRPARGYCGKAGKP